MSNIYIQEPPTNGKVLLQTTVGDIDVELWSKEAPRACRNFVQLCMEGYYNGTIFHRVIKEFIVQGGDPTGTGHGGESIYGKPFRDEFHSRLRFNHRGLVAMANAGPNDNGSQFFFTLGATPELDRKHTIFGKVAGNTVYNMLRLGEAETNNDDRPLYPHKILKTKVLYNPFEDIVPRVSAKREEKEDESKKKKSKMKGTKNFSLLSFGEEAEEDEEQVNQVVKDLKHKSKSSHDLLNDKKLSSVPAVELPEPDTKRRTQQSESSDSSVPPEEEMTQEDKDAMKERIRKKLKGDDTKYTKHDKERSSGKEKKRKKHDSGKMDAKLEESKEKRRRSDVDEDKTEHHTDKDSKRHSDDSKHEDDRSNLSKIEQLKQEAKMLKRELMNKKKAKDDSTEEKAKKSQNEVLAAYEEERKKYMDRKINKNKSAREKETLAILAKFQSKLSATRRMMEYDEDEEDHEDKNEASDEDDPSDLSWMNHKLRFESRESKVLDPNISDADRYEIFDPRNPLTQRRREASKKAMKEKR